MKTYTIGIIGGTGGMGRWFEHFFRQAGHQVLISGRKTALTTKELTQESDIIILSVPFDAALELCPQIGPLLNSDQLLMDFCSLKEEILKHMLQHTTAQVIGTHPLFGPFTDSIRGQNVIVCPGRGMDWMVWLEDEFKSKGAIVTRMAPMDHDRNMAVIQGLTHLLTVCMGRALQKLNMTPDTARYCATPVFRIKLDLIGRLLAQDLNLYADLIGKNSYVQEVLETFMTSLDEGKKFLLSGQNGDADGFLNDIRSFFGSFCKTALKDSNRMIDALYQRKF
ncbi:MAG: prephenate dehydrogenase/arogenate dehydrogenase family protein [Desulfobacterales bacterium]|nr:prephenate dehydrogenase/arogenate dehydrogenase family protein [Desulfobacterales bacterium]